ITYEYDGLITLEFEIGEDEEIYCEEPFFISGENQFIIKSIDDEVVTCTLDFTSLKKDFYVGQKSFDSQTLNDILHHLLDPVSWEIKNAQSVKIRRTLTVEDESLLSAIFKLEELYNCTFEFDCKNKILKVIDEGVDRDYIVSKDINLEKFIIKKDTYEHYTRIYGFGKDNMTFSSINNDKEYVENLSYNTNIIPAVFRDDRFTDKLNLKKHCEELLEKHSKPLIEYELSIIELERRDLRLHDVITFLNYKTKKKEKHRIIEITKYSDDETKNEIKFINRTENLSEFLQNRKEQISQEVKKEIGRYDFSSRFDESIKKATSKFEKLLLNGYKIETENGTYYVDKLPKEKAKNVLRIGLGGIMGSSTGWNGPYSLAISNDGVINADRILTGFLDSDRIKANSITADKLTVRAKEEITNGLVKKENFNNFLVNNQVLKSEITESVTSEVSKVKVGARNLLPNSDFFNKSEWHTFGAKSIEYNKLNDVEDWGDCESIKLVERNTD
ncbi:MAG: phage tail protein, partial [Parvimonas micra]|nr:phage tail protein [Parvimonas micra]